MQKSSNFVGEECESKILILEREYLTRVNLSMDTELVKAGQSGQIWSNIQIWSKTGQRKGV